MSSIIIGKIEGLKLKNGKVIPFLLSASSNVRIAGNSLAWDWHNMHMNGNPSFMFEKAEELFPLVKDWASQGMFRYRGGTFITEKGMMKRLGESFENPLFRFEEGLIMVTYIHISKDRTKAEHVMFKPKTEEDFLDYMDKFKNRNLTVTLLPNLEMSQTLTAFFF